jgi:hypothetical protein
VELLRDRDGEAWFVELNGRPWGSMALSRRSGLEYPAWAVLDALGRGSDINRPAAVAGVRCRHLGRELVHLLFVLRGTDRRGPMWPSRAACLREVVRVRRDDHWYNWRPGHLGLFVEDSVQTVTGALARRTA